MAGRNGRLNYERILKFALLIISFISIVTGISVFAHGLIKTKILPRFTAEDATEETEASEEETEESSEDDVKSEDEASADSGYVDTNDIEASDDDSAGTGKAADDDEYTDEEKLALEMELAEKDAEDSVADESENVTENPTYISGVFIAADIDIPRALAPTLALKKDGTFDLTLNVDDNMKTYHGSYTTSKKQNEMDDVYVYLSLSGAGGGIPNSATVVFSDSPDYCEFLDEGFGLMGYSGAPYGFYRDERE